MAIWQCALKALKVHILLYPEILTLGIYLNVIIKDNNMFMNKKHHLERLYQCLFHHQSIRVSSTMLLTFIIHL